MPREILKGMLGAWYFDSLPRLGGEEGPVRGAPQVHKYDKVSEASQEGRAGKREHLSFDHAQRTIEDHRFALFSFSLLFLSPTHISPDSLCPVDSIVSSSCLPPPLPPPLLPPPLPPPLLPPPIPLPISPPASCHSISPSSVLSSSVLPASNPACSSSSSPVTREANAEGERTETETGRPEDATSPLSDIPLSATSPTPHTSPSAMSSPSAPESLSSPESPISSPASPSSPTLSANLPELSVEERQAKLEALRQKRQMLREKKLREKELREKVGTEYDNGESSPKCSRRCKRKEHANPGVRRSSRRCRPTVECLLSIPDRPARFDNIVKQDKDPRLLIRLPLRPDEPSLVFCFCFVLLFFCWILSFCKGQTQDMCLFAESLTKAVQLGSVPLCQENAPQNDDANQLAKEQKESKESVLESGHEGETEKAACATTHKDEVLSDPKVGAPPPLEGMTITVLEAAEPANEKPTTPLPKRKLLPKGLVRKRSSSSAESGSDDSSDKKLCVTTDSCGSSKECIVANQGGGENGNDGGSEVSGSGGSEASCSGDNGDGYDESWMLDSEDDGDEHVSKSSQSQEHKTSDTDKSSEQKEITTETGVVALSSQQERKVIEVGKSSEQVKTKEQEHGNGVCQSQSERKAASEIDGSNESQQTPEPIIKRPSIFDARSTLKPMSIYQGSSVTKVSVEKRIAYKLGLLTKCNLNKPNPNAGDTQLQTALCQLSTLHALR